MTTSRIAADLRAEAAKRARYASGLPAGEMRAREFGYAAGMRDAAVYLEAGKVTSWTPLAKVEP